MRFLIGLTLLLFVVAGCRTAPEAAQPYRVEPVPPGSVVTIDAPFWEQVPMCELGPVPGYVKRFPVRIQFAYDGEALYFRFTAEDDDLLDEAPDELTCGLDLFADAVEFFVRPPESRGYWEFHFTAGGRFGAIHFPSRGRRMPSNVAYLPMDGLTFEVKRDGTLNNMKDRDRGWSGLARIPFAGIADRCAPVDLNRPLLIQVTSIAYSVYADQDEKSQLTCSSVDPDPHYLPVWSELIFTPDSRAGNINENGKNKDD